jgi:short-subunit dehydrogenase
MILITGCSTGIGRALAIECHKRGLAILATARKAESVADLSAQGIRTTELDVTDTESIARLPLGEVKTLINNAGYLATGPMAEMPLSELRKQFETNVVAVAAMVRAVFPTMAERGSGLIVNIGSVSAVFPTPFAGAYCASKAAVHAMSEAMRVELAPFGIRVMTVQPGKIRSSIADNSRAALERTVVRGGYYESIRAKIEKRAAISQKGAITAEDCARRIVDAMLRPKPPVLFRVGPGSTTLPILKRLVPVRLLDYELARRFGLLSLGRKRG